MSPSSTGQDVVQWASFQQGSLLTCAKYRSSISCETALLCASATSSSECSSCWLLLPLSWFSGVGGAACTRLTVQASAGQMSWVHQGQTMSWSDMVYDAQHHFLCNLYPKSLVSMQHCHLSSRHEVCLHSIGNPQACNADASRLPRAWLFHLCVSGQRPVSATCAYFAIRQTSCEAKSHLPRQLLQPGLGSSSAPQL